MYFFLLLLGILLNLGLDANYKQVKFFKTLLEKSFKFVLQKRNNNIAFMLRFVLLLIEVDQILEKQGRKRHAFVVYSSDHVKIILTLLAKKNITLYTSFDSTS